MTKKEDISLEANPEEFPSLEELKQILGPITSDEELKEILESKRLHNMIKWIRKHNLDKSDDLPTLDHVFAYPNYNAYMSIPGQHNMDRWISAVRDIVSKEQSGIDYKMALSQATQGWQPMEILDFVNWLKYYQEGAHVKYKYAQFYYGDMNNGYMIPIKKETPQENLQTGEPTIEVTDSAAERKEMIEKQRNKILSRLDSVEKLLRSTNGQLFSGNELSSFLESIHDLKRRILQFNKQTLSSKTYDDMIIRQANVLRKNGFVKASGLLYSLAEENLQLESSPVDPTAGNGEQESSKKPAESTKLPPPASPAPPAQSSGAVGGLPSTGPGMPQTPPESASQISPAVNQLIKNLNFGDTSHVDDNIEVNDTDDELVVEAQLAPTEAPAPTETPIPPPTPVTAPAEIEPKVEDKIEVEDETPLEKSNFDSKIDSAFSNLTVADVVAKLEDLAKIFKVREVPRQLSIVDMMLDSLGLASYFPSLSEATNKALESNNYISTRVEDILSKLRGAMKTHDIDLKGVEKEENPETQALRGKLQQDQDKEKARKEMRKEQEAQELESKTKETPEIEVEEDLTPAPAPAPAPPPAKPVV